MSDPARSVIVLRLVSAAFSRVRVDQRYQIIITIEPNAGKRRRDLSVLSSEFSIRQVHVLEILAQMKINSLRTWLEGHEKVRFCFLRENDYSYQ